MGKRYVRAGARLIGLALALFVLAVLCVGLAQALDASTNPSPSTGKVVLRLGYMGDPDSLNPLIAQLVPSYLAFNVIYDRLVGVDPATLAPSKETGLAKDWSVSDDGLTWTFTLRDGPTWQDNGWPVTAKDVAFTYNYIIDNRMVSFLGFVTGIRSVTASGPRTVAITCSSPKADMLLACNSIWVLPEHIWSKITPEAATSSFQNNPPIVGSGPFHCIEYKKSNYVTMEANKDYWRDAPKIDELIFECYTNEDTMAQDLKAGTIDGATGLLNSQLQMYKRDPNVTAESIKVNGNDDLGFNCYEPPPGGKSLGNPVLRDWRFRQALQWAVNKQKIVNIVYYGNAAPGDTVITGGYYTDPDWHWTPPTDQAYTFNLDTASQKLTEAGYPLKDGVRLDKQGKPITLRLWSRQQSVTSQAIGRMLAGWFQQLGLKIELGTLDEGVLLAKVYNMEGDTFVPDFDLCIWGWYNFTDPGENLSYFCTDQINGRNDSAYSNPEFDKLYVEQSQTIDTAKREAILDQMQQIIYHDSPYIVLTYNHETEGWNTTSWTGWAHSPSGFGNVINQTGGMPTFLHVEQSAASDGKTGSTGAPMMLGAGIALAVIAGFAWTMLPRRRTAPGKRSSRGHLIGDGHCEGGAERSPIGLPRNSG